MNKLVVNHLDKTIVTSDGATIVQELEVMHPAAKMVVMASQMQEQESGDGTSLVVTLTGEYSQCRIGNHPVAATFCSVLKRGADSRELVKAA